jgi:hypothetical protein
MDATAERVTERWRSPIPPGRFFGRREFMPALKQSTWLLIASAALIVALAATNVRAQDFDQEPSADASAADHVGCHHHGLSFKLHGRANVKLSSCPPNTCFSFTSHATATSNCGNSEPAFVRVPDGTFTNCQTTANVTTCDASGHETVTVKQGTVDFTFSGPSSQATGSTQVTLNVSLACSTGPSGCGTGLFKGATGSGFETVSKGKLFARGQLQ